MLWRLNGKSVWQIEWWCQTFHRKLANSRICACAANTAENHANVAMPPKILIILHEIDAAEKGGIRFRTGSRNIAISAHTERNNDQNTRKWISSDKITPLWDRRRKIEWWRHNVDQKLISRPFCACAVKIQPKILFPNMLPNCQNFDPLS